MSSSDIFLIKPSSYDDEDTHSNSETPTHYQPTSPLSRTVGDETLTEYLEGHTSMLKGCVQQTFIHVRGITDHVSRKRSYSAPCVIQRARKSYTSAGSLVEVADSDGGGSYEDDNLVLFTTARHVNVLMFKPRHARRQANANVQSANATTPVNLPSSNSPCSCKFSDVESVSTDIVLGDSFGPILEALERSQCSATYLDDLSKLYRTPIKDEEPMFSRGGGFHDLNTCKPCMFYWAKGCKNGNECPFCHHYHAARKNKDKKKKQAKQSRRMPLLAPEPAILSHQNFGRWNASLSPTASSSSSAETTPPNPICCPVLCDTKRWRDMQLNAGYDIPVPKDSGAERPGSDSASSHDDRSPVPHQIVSDSEITNEVHQCAQMHKLMLSCCNCNLTSQYPDGGQHTTAGTIHHTVDKHHLNRTFRQAHDKQSKLLLQPLAAS